MVEECSKDFLLVNKERRKMNVPYVQLRELTLDDVEDRYQWSLDRDVTKHLVVQINILRSLVEIRETGLKLV